MKSNIKFGISYKNIYANDFVYNDNNIIGVNQSNILSKNLGKAIVANKITGTNFMIGDGYTDYEVKEKKSSKYFIQFIENINRKTLNSKADFIAQDFNDIIRYVKQ